ncbi:MAG: polysaccharide deacetylase family protein [Solirubrobacteraceae bacterium]
MDELILTFHGLGTPPHDVSDSERKVWVPVQWLEAILGVLPPAGVRIAFDDGNRSDVDDALPVLTRSGRSAQFFVLAGEFDKPGRIGPEDVATLHRAGMRIGSHGLHHRDWRRISDAELAGELSESRLALSKIVKLDVVEAACPFGSYDRRVIKALHTAGYQRAYTSDGGATTGGRWLAARSTVTREQPLEHWLALAAAGPTRPEPTLLLKRCLKRIR